MICRLWRGWTSPENADAYERIVRKELSDESARSASVDSFLSDIENLPSPRGSQVATGGGA